MSPTMISSLNLTQEKTFKRLLLSTEKLVQDKSIEDWKLNQFVTSLQDMLKDMKKSMSRPSSKQLDEYKQRVDILRHNIDPIKLEDQTFPRRIQIDLPVKEQPTEIPSPVIAPPPPLENTITTSNSDRSNLNRQQQHIQSEEDKQDTIATSMSRTTKSMLNNAQRLHDIVKDDEKKLNEAENLVDNNTAKLHVQSKRLKQHAYSGSNCWIYLMLILVMITFIYLTLFMRMFRKRITKVIYTNIASQSNLLNKSFDQTTINDTNITTTKSTDYISLLLNYASENHTDL